MKLRIVPVATILLAGVGTPSYGQSGSSFGEVQRYTVYCADEGIEVSFWDLAQMIVRRGNPVCQFASYTSYSDALTFAKKNFGGEGSPCIC